MDYNSSLLDMFEFLDLSDATTEERTQAMAIIQSVAPGIELPFPCKPMESKPSAIEKKHLKSASPLSDETGDQNDSLPSLENAKSPTCNSGELIFTNTEGEVANMTTDQQVNQWKINELVVSTGASLVCQPHSYAIFPTAAPAPYFTNPNASIQPHFYPPTTTLPNGNEAIKLRTGSNLVNTTVNQVKSDIRPPFYTPNHFAESQNIRQSQPNLTNIEVTMNNAAAPVPPGNYPVPFMPPNVMAPTFVPGPAPYTGPFYVFPVAGAPGQFMYIHPQMSQLPIPRSSSPVPDETKISYDESSQGVSIQNDCVNENLNKKDNDLVEENDEEGKTENDEEDKTEKVKKILVENEMKCDDKMSDSDLVDCQVNDSLNFVKSPNNIEVSDSEFHINKAAIDEMKDEIVEESSVGSKTEQIENDASNHNRSWASLFKNSSLASHNSVMINSIPNSVLENTSTHNSHHESSPINTISLNHVDNCESDAQISVIPLSQDSFATTKLVSKLRKISLKHSLPYLIPCGFVNRGNWCYINATLQALIACPPFFNLMKEIGEIQGIFRESSSTPIIDSFAKFFTYCEYMKKSTKNSLEDVPKLNPFEPKCIYDVLGMIKTECMKGRQEDAEEFLSSVLNGLHDEMIALFKINEKNKDSINTNGNHLTTNGHLHDNDESHFDYQDEEENNDDDENVWKEVGSRHKALPTREAKIKPTPVSEIFVGSIISVRTANKDVCANRQSFFALQLDIQSEKIKSVEDAIRHLNASESIQGFTCPKTKQTITASNQIFLDTLPPILIIHLKLFVYNKDGGCRKLLKKIDCPVDLDLPKECLYHNSHDNSFRRYKLLSVVYHDGNEAVKGHYITDVFHIGSSQWLRCDDGTVKVMSNPPAKMFCSEGAMTPYLLFYRRSDTLKHNSTSKGQKSSHLH